ncbi:MAG: hypothetical protein JHC33_10740 [Ignisphaera sp.]|nr:hypothetical protein [Ignisphaera sp.]
MITTRKQVIEHGTEEEKVALVNQVFEKNTGTGLYRRGLIRRKKILNEIKVFEVECRDREVKVTDSEVKTV